MLLASSCSDIISGGAINRFDRQWRPPLHNQHSWKFGVIQIIEFLPESKQLQSMLPSKQVFHSLLFHLFLGECYDLLTTVLVVFLQPIVQFSLFHHSKSDFICTSVQTLGLLPFQF
jgi:hypothetical protein